MCRCSWCNCDSDEHDEYRKCPLLNGKELCDICCDYDIQAYNPEKGRLEIIDVIKRITGKDMTEKEVAKVCVECGKNGRVLEYYLKVREERTLKIGHKYRHFKNKDYLVKGVAKSPEGETMVLYHALYGEAEAYVEPSDNILGVAKHSENDALYIVYDENGSLLLKELTEADKGRLGVSHNQLTGQLYIRPIDMFLDKKEYNGKLVNRFEEIGD